MSVPLYQVDAFTLEPFAGNPAAVCVLNEARDDPWLQAVAAEMNLSETAFVRQLEDGFELRWFTPKVEVSLCGHATLAAAHVLWQRGDAAADSSVQFQSKSGPLAARQTGGRIELDFPLEPAEACPTPGGLLESLGAEARWIGRNRFDYLVEVDDESALRALRPDFAALARIETRGVIVTCRSASSEFDVVSRYFAPAAGIDEDPVTGSAHCCLGPYWRERLGKHEFVASQASARGGLVHVRVTDRRAYLGGHAVTIVEGTLRC